MQRDTAAGSCSFEAQVGRVAEAIREVVTINTAQYDRMFGRPDDW